ncbi:MAG: hypothetical protein ACN4GM_02265 [Gammaproteobacteria bacterium]
MRIYSRPLLICLSLFSLYACQQGVKASPDWINHPGSGAVGSATTHVKGRYYQEQLAIARARERLAARYGAEISSVLTIREKVVNDHAYVSSNKAVLQQINSTEVKAHVREIWHNTDKDVVWVWVYPVTD